MFGNIPIIVLVLLLVSISIYFIVMKSSFNNLLVNNITTPLQPKVFPPITKPLEPPTVKEEIGLAMVYPQGSGVGMSKLDSNAFTPSKPGPLLTDYSIPESFGESSLSDPTGIRGANEGARIIKLKGTGNQMNFKPMDEAESILYSAAYSDNEVQNGPALLNGNRFINYSDSFRPEANLILQSSPGQETDLNNCDTTYPNVEKYDGYCITEGDIPYGKIVNGKVNPRLVSRWESYTGQYSREEALGSIDGLLYPKLNVLVQ